MFNRPNVFDRPVENAERAKRAAARPLRARQDATVSATKSAAASTAYSSGISATATAGASPSNASSTATVTDDESSGSSETADATDTAVLTLTTGLTTDAGGNVVVVTDIVERPQYTATHGSVYEAHGVNATSHTASSTTYVQYPGLEHTDTHSSTSTSSAPGAWAKGFGIPTNELTRCTIDGENNTAGPFCTPKHNQRLWVGFTYAFTWNPDHYPLNATNRIQIQYDDTSLGNATVGDPVPAYLGYYDFEMPEDWLHGAAGNDSTTGQNLTVIMISDPAGPEIAEIVDPGPKVSLVRDPASLPKEQFKKLPSKYGLEVGLPIGLVALIILLLSLCCAVKRNNKQFQSIRGVGKDYMARRDRRRGRKGGDIQLDEMDVGTEDRYMDQPVKGGENVFRDEIRRQRKEDDEARRNVTSF